MKYIEHTITLVVPEKDSEVLTQGLSKAMDHLEEAQGITIYSVLWDEQVVPKPVNAEEEAAAEPKNAAEMGAGAS